MKFTVSSSIRIVRSLSAFCRLHKMNVATSLCGVLALLASPLAYGSPSAARYSGTERTVYSANGANLPSVAVDASGTVYIADQNNNRVLKETPSGLGYTQTTVGPASDALGFTPLAVAVDPFFNVYIVDGANSRVLKETWSGGAYTETVAATGLNNPIALAVDGGQNIFILDRGDLSIQMEMWSDNSYVLIPLTTITGLGNPVGIAVDSSSGNLFITDNANGWVLKATSGCGPDDYTLATYSMGGGHVTGIAIDGNGNLYVEGGEGGNGYDPLYFETWNGSGFDETEVATTQLSGSFGVAVGANGHIYIADGGNNRVIEEIPAAAADFGSVAVGTASASATMLFAFSGIQTGISPVVVTQGTPGLDFADALSGTCTTNGTDFIYDTTTGINYRDGRNLFCSVDVTLTPAFPGGRFGAASLVQAGSTIATGYAYGIGTGPQVVFTNPPQVQVDNAETHALGIAADGAGNLYVGDSNTNTVILVASGGGITTVSSSALASPSAVAVDGAGNVYIADTGNARILKEKLVAGSPSTGTYTETMVPHTLALSQPTGVAVDGSGNVYIADVNANLVLKETLARNAYTETQVTNTALTNPQGVAVDGNGVVYIADTGAGLVLKETPSGGSYAETTVGSGLTLPSGVAVDAGGNVFISDVGSSNILMESFSSGTYIPTILINNSDLNGLQGIAVNGVGDVFYVNGTILKLTMSAPTVLASFADTPIGSSSAPQTVGIQNVGNADLSFAVPSNGNNPSIAANFTLDSSGVSACPLLNSESSTATLAAGSFCLLPISFVPLTADPITGSLVITDNQLNAAGPVYTTQSILLSGTGLPETPVITFTVADQTYGVSPFAVSASSSSTGAFTYSVTSGPATISGSVVTLTGAGMVVLHVVQAADSNYTTASQDTSFNVAPAVPAITFAVSDHTYGDAAFVVSASSASTGAFAYAVVSGPATITGATVMLTGAGTVVLSATEAADSNYTSASQNATFTVEIAVPVISFAVNDHTFGDAAFAVSASSASSGAFTYSVVSGPATVSGATVTITGAGTVVLSATQAANGNYAVGSQNASFTVAPEVPTITFNVSDHTFGDAAFAVSASSASLGAFTYALVSGPATVLGTTVTITGAGTVVLSATQAANGNYAVGSQNASFTVADEVPAITFAVSDHTFGDAAFVVSASSASSGAFTYSVVSGPATISSSTVTITGAGTVVLSATQAANGSYAAATKNTSFTVDAGVPILVFAPITSQTTDSLPFSVSASSLSTGAIAYVVVSGPATIAGSTVTLTGTGTVTLSATQIAAGSYTSAVATISFIVTPGFTVAPNAGGDSGSATTTPGGAVTYGLMLTPGSGTTTFPDAITFSVTGLPAGSTATFSPPTILAGSGSTIVTLTIQTSKSQASTGESRLPLGPIAPFALGLLLPLLGTKRALRRLQLVRFSPVAALVLLAALAALGGCGGSPSPAATPQSYTVVVTATDTTTGARSSANVTLTVQ